MPTVLRLCVRKLLYLLFRTFSLSVRETHIHQPYTLVTSSCTRLSYENDTALVNLNITATAAGRGLGVSLQSMGIPSYQKSYRRVDSATLSLDPTPQYIVSTVTFPILMVRQRLKCYAYLSSCVPYMSHTCRMVYVADTNL